MKKTDLELLIKELDSIKQLGYCFYSSDDSYTNKNGGVVGNFSFYKEDRSSKSPYPFRRTFENTEKFNIFKKHVEDNFSHKNAFKESNPVKAFTDTLDTHLKDPHLYDCFFIEKIFDFEKGEGIHIIYYSSTQEKGHQYRKIYSDLPDLLDLAANHLESKFFRLDNKFDAATNKDKILSERSKTRITQAGNPKAPGSNSLYLRSE